MSPSIVQIRQKDLSKMEKDIASLKGRLEIVDHTFAVKSYMESRGKLKGCKDVNAFINDL